MSETGARTAERIRKELTQLAETELRIAYRLDVADGEPEHAAIAIESIAFALEAWYSGVERVFRAIATKIDGAMPTGEHWHIELLARMSLAIPAVRPAVISEEVLGYLDTYRTFRHAARNLYPHDLVPDKVLAEARVLPRTGSLLRDELEAFARILDQI